MKRFLITLFGLVLASFIVGCQSGPKEKPSFTQAEVDFYKKNTAARDAEDIRCRELTDEESELDKKCLIVAEAHHQLLTEDYTYKGKAPDMSFNPYGRHKLMPEKVK